MAASVAIGDGNVAESKPDAKSQSQPQILHADKLVDSIFRALSSTNGNNGNNDNNGGGNNVPGAINGGDGTREALKEL
ncbi:unnamed protein product, partial [Ectocarpus fasciculatus]